MPHRLSRCSHPIFMEVRSTSTLYARRKFLPSKKSLNSCASSTTTKLVDLSHPHLAGSAHAPLCQEFSSFSHYQQKSPYGEVAAQRLSAKLHGWRPSNWYAGTRVDHYSQWNRVGIWHCKRYYERRTLINAGLTRGLLLAVALAAEFMWP